jgi:hypothetical protein
VWEGCVLLNKKDAISIERQPRKSGGLRIVYIFKCITEKCNNKVKVRSSELKTRAGTCISCSQRHRPFETIYNNIGKDDRNLEVKLTYDEFIEFTKIKECYYCGSRIPWTPYPVINGDFISMAYFLDRKINKIGYSKENCVVCCTLCNKLKRAHDHYDFIIICNRIAENFKKKLTNFLETGILDL